jgi:hypothetical protein
VKNYPISKDFKCPFNELPEILKHSHNFGISWLQDFQEGVMATVATSPALYENSSGINQSNMYNIENNIIEN